MKIIEALKELPLLEKRIEKNVQLVQLYSSELDLGQGVYTFGDEAKQRSEVRQLVQATEDLISRKAKLRRALALTNVTVTVTIAGDTKTIQEWIEYREKGTKSQVALYTALNVNQANAALGNAQRPGNTGIDLSNGVRIVRFFDEKEKNERIGKLLEQVSNINAQLEIVNATTDMVEAA